MDREESCMKSCDVGSLPFVGDIKRYVEGGYQSSSSPTSDSSNFFEAKLIDAFLDKIGTGIDVPNYPQFRDMGKMFLALLDGVEEVGGSYVETKALSVKADKRDISEVKAIERNSRLICEKKGEPFIVRVSVTGPYTLSSYFSHKDSELFTRLGNALSQIIEQNIFHNKYGKVGLVAVDEPIFGLRDDPSLDYGSDGRDNLTQAWEILFQKAHSRNIQTVLHLHNTADDLYWDLASLDIIDSHVGDSIYSMEKTKKQLELTDKFLKASIAITDFNTLIKQRFLATSPHKITEFEINEKVAEAWRGIQKHKIDSESFLEKTDVMKARLAKIIRRVGYERVAYAGPECGLKSFPSYECALVYLKRVSNAVDKISQKA